MTDFPLQPFILAKEERDDVDNGEDIQEANVTVEENNEQAANI